MAAFTFETLTQSQASAFTGGDTLAFSATGATASAVGVAVVDQTVVLTLGATSLSFPATALFQASVSGLVSFPDQSALLIGSSAGERITGTIRADAIHGLAGDDILEGGAGDDDIFGGPGADMIIAGAGNHHLYGNSRISQQGAADGEDTIEGGTGKDYIQGNAGNDILRGNGGDDRILGGAGDDRAQGGDGADQINGNVGNDTVEGGDGNDVVRGGQGNDQVLGGDGNDNLYGDLGDDVLTGGAGVDILFGGGGSDLFLFVDGDASAANIGGSGELANLTDVIADFANGADKLKIGTTTSSVVLDTQGSIFGSVAGARTYAQGLVNATATTNSLEAVALKFGGDTYLFWQSSVGTSIDSAVKLLNFNPTDFDLGDFAS